MVMQLALVENAAAGPTLGGFLVGILSGVIVVFIGRSIAEAHETSLRTKRLQRSLACDCALLAQSMKRVRRQISEFATVDYESNLADNIAKLYTGFVVSGPLEQLKELIQYVDPNIGGLVTYLLDRWDRFSGVEARYYSAHANLVAAAAKMESSVEVSKEQRFLANEYWSDIKSELENLNDCAEDITYVCCKLIRHCQSTDEDFLNIGDVSISHWKTWEAFALDESECSEVWQRKRGKE